MIIASALHVLSAVIWVGGMFFAYMALRPVAASLLEPPLRLPLWVQVFRKFFLWVWKAVVLLLASGYWMVFDGFGGFANTGSHVHIMHGLGLIMVALYLYVFFGPYKKLGKAVAEQEFKSGAEQLNRIRKVIAVNLSLGLIVVVVASGGRFWSG